MRRLLLAPLVAVLLACTPAGESQTPEPGPTQVEWSTWETSTFVRANGENKLILINVIASWCHWCHVMDEVTYHDPEVVALLREHFVVIRVDSDARPDILERYRAWGWPATAILSPEAQPVVNLRGFREPEVFAALLHELVDEHARGELREHAVAEPKAAPADADLKRIRDKAAAQLDGYFDVEGLGWGGKQKYPWPEPIEYAFVRALLHAQDEAEVVWRERALATLEAEVALIDPVWGGMYQYSLKGVWDRPHYEKIAMIQAGALDNYAQATLLTRDPRWLEPARAITGYVLGPMQDPAGGFYTSQDADLRRKDGTSVVGLEYYALDDAGRRALGIPRIDAAVYADLNGLTIHGLCELYRASADPALLEAAARAAERILKTHRGSDGGFSHGPDAPADELRYLADQAAMGWALVALHRVTGEPRWLAEAETTAQYMVAHLRDEHGGLHAHTVDPSAVGVFADRRTPLPENALAAQFFIELHGLLDGDGSAATPYREYAREILLAVGDDEQLESRGKIVGRYLLALERLMSPSYDLTIVAAPGDPAGEALAFAAMKLWDPRVTIERSAPGERYPDTGEAAIYLCSDTACSAPMTDPARVVATAEAFLAD